MFVLGGSGLGSGLLEPPELGPNLLSWVLGLASDFRGPPELGSCLLEHPGWILLPWELPGLPGVYFLLGWLLASWGFLAPPGLDSGFWGLHGLSSGLNDQATFRTSSS